MPMSKCYRPATFRHDPKRSRHLVPADSGRCWVRTNLGILAGSACRPLTNVLPLIYLTPDVRPCGAGTSWHGGHKGESANRAALGSLATIQRGAVMRRFVMVGAALGAGTVLGMLTLVAGSTAAWADGPQHVKSTATFDFTVPAGTFCDFALHNSGTVSDNVVILPDKMIDHVDLYEVHENAATGFTLTETDHFTEFTAADGQVKDVGIFWHLRTADGKLVVSATGEVLKVTPSVNPDSAAVICPALGGQPAS